MWLVLDLRREYGWSRKDFVKVLELLTSLVLVGVRNNFSIDFSNIGKSIDNESSEENGVRHFIILN